MSSEKQILDKLNSIRAVEQRQELVYRRLSSMVTGPYRVALSDEFDEHAETEAKHANIVMNHIMALGGDLTTEVEPIPVWHNLDEALTGLEEFEEEGIKAWQELMHMLSEDDAFRHTIESILEREQEHYDDVKRWRRTDFMGKSMANNVGDLGSLVPLNVQMREKVFHESVVKAESLESQILRASRAGTPPTRWGTINGAVSSLTPGIPTELNPKLHLTKAVADPALAGTGSGGDTASRKRDPSTGQFSAVQSAGPVSTAEEDAAAASRQERVSAKQYTQVKSLDEDDDDEDTKKAFGSPSSGQSPVLARPKMTPMQQPPTAELSSPSGMSEDQNGAAPLGNTPDGLPVYDDPYHTGHSQFTPDQHQAAADLHNQHAAMATTSGRIPTALDHQLKARIHSDMANDSQSPMQRMVAMAGGNNATSSANAPANAPTNDKMTDFLTQLPDKNPNMKNMNPDQNKPNVGSPEQVQGPLPRMTNTHTSSPVGPQTQAAQHAGTVSQPQVVPPEPGPGQGSMPDIKGPQEQQVSGAVSPQSIEAANAPEDDETVDTDNVEDPHGFGAIGGPMAAPSSSAGAATAFQPAMGNKPTPGGSASAPAMNAGPSTNDSKKPPEANPFTGNATEQKSKEDRAMKSFMTWFDTL